MIGKLTIDKSSMNISYFLNTIRIISSNGGEISRKDFVNKMATFMGQQPTINDTEESRTPYNKSKLPRYFGFVDVVIDAQEQQLLVLTNRGKELSNIISEKETTDPEQKYYISKEDREKFIDLLFESVIFSSFGKNNCGVEQSNTDVEPPKVVFRTIYELGRATSDEICFVIYGLNNGLFSSFDEAIRAIKRKRESFNYNYDEYFEKWKIKNIAHDCKIINIFTNDSIRLLEIEQDNETGKKFYRLSSSLSESHIEQIAKLDVIYQPIRMMLYSKNERSLKEWVNNSVLGGVSNDEFVFHYKKSDGDFLGKKNGDSEYEPGCFDKLLLKAFENQKKNVYLVVEDTTEQDFTQMFGKFKPLLERIDDLSSEEHGWSSNYVEDDSIASYITSVSPKAKKYIQNGRIRIPSNIQMLGMITMNNENNESNFDFKFTKSLVDLSEEKDDNSMNDNKNLYRKWMADQRKEDGTEKYKSTTRSNYVSALNVIKSEYGIDIFSIKELDAFERAYSFITSMDNFNEFNNSPRMGGTPLPALDRYREFLTDLQKDGDCSLTSVEYAWFVGATGNGDHTDEYINSGIWINGYDNKFVDVVKSIKVGDRIAIKASFTQKNGLPYDNRGDYVSAIRIKAIGVVKSNPGDGKKVEVEWTRLNPTKDWYEFLTFQDTINCVKASDGYLSKQLLDFTFCNGEQDYTICADQHRRDTDQVTDAVSTVTKPFIELQFKTNLTLKYSRNRIVFGAPGTGKSRVLEDDKEEIIKTHGGTFERVTFHPDYTYANFVGTYKPVPKADGISYEYVPGPFMRVYVDALKDARDNNDHAEPHILIVEEINRANVAGVFGDVFQLLDRKDNVSEYAIQPSEDLKAFLAGDKGLNAGTPDDYNEIRLPDNMFIWATMNSADQGVFPMDTAFKRRWNFSYLGINAKEDKIIGDKEFKIGTGEHEKDITWNSIRRAINDRLTSLRINEDKLLGPFFIGKEDLKDTETFIDTFKDKVLMYLFEDAAKQRRKDLFVKTDIRYSELCTEFDEKGIDIFVGLEIDS